MSEAQMKAQAEYRAVRDALFVLGLGTAGQIAAICGLDPKIVERRLRTAGPEAIRPEWRKFRYDPLGKLWSLTLGTAQECERDAAGQP